MGTKSAQLREPARDEIDWLKFLDDWRDVQQPGADDGCTVQDIAVRTGQNRNKVSAAISRAIEAGHVVRSITMRPMINGYMRRFVVFRLVEPDKKKAGK